MVTAVFADEARDSSGIDSVLDREWIKSTFLLSDKELGGKSGYKVWLLANRYRTTADEKFTSSAIGMSMAVNAKPQFTRYADVRSKGKIIDREDVSFEKMSNAGAKSGNSNFGLGMGGYYSMAIDDNAQRIYMRFGVRSNTFLTTWFSNVFDPKRAAYANKGFIGGLILEVADVVSTAAAVVGAVASFLPFLALGVGAFNLYKTFTGTSSSRFFSVQPTMHAYWMAVEDILNSLMAKRTLMPTIAPDYNSNTDNKIGAPGMISAGYLAALHEALPDIFDKNGRVSVFGLALKSQRAFNQMWKQDHDDNEKNPMKMNFLDYPLKANNEGHNSYFTASDGTQTISTKLFAYAHKLFGSSSVDGAVNPADKESMKNIMNMNPMQVQADGNETRQPDPANPSETTDTIARENVAANSSKFAKFQEYFLSELTSGASFAVFNVESTGAVGESFSNSLQANPLEGTLNSLSSKARSVAGMAGSVTNVPILGDMIKGAADVVAVMVSNNTWGLANPLLALLYGVNIELPKDWESSSTDFTKADYKMRLFTPYRNPISQLVNLYLPLAMIIAGTAARGTGSQSYTSPFLCQLYDRGRCQITLGMITSLSISRGTSNLPFSRKGQISAIDVDFSVTNLDNVMFAPIAEGGFMDTVKQALMPLQTDNTFNDYISVVAGLDVMSQVYGVPKLRLALGTAYLKLGRYFDPDPAYFASLTAGIANVGLFTALGSNGKVKTQ